MCIIPSCAGGTDACDGAVCHDLSIDPAHCGRCDNACTSMATAVVGCVDGGCVAVACLPYHAHCDADATGCETAVGGDEKNCGGCGIVCGGSLECKLGVCRCTTDSACGEGRCGNKTDGRCQCAQDAGICQLGETCNAGVCTCGSHTCEADQACCGALGCVPINVPERCGTCGIGCAPRFECSDGGPFVCQCTDDASCQAGPGISGATCNAGICQCGKARCVPGQRCLSNESCG